MGYRYELRLAGGNHDSQAFTLERDRALGDPIEFTWPCCGQRYAGPLPDEPFYSIQGAVVVALSYEPVSVPAAFEAAFTQYPR